MLLLPTTLTTLSVTLGAALLSVPGPEVAMLPTAALVAEIAYLPEVRTDDASVHTEPGLPYLADVVAAADDSGQPGADVAHPPDTIARQDSEQDSGFGLAADSDSLDGLRGGDGSSSTIVMNGTVADNRATNVVTGTNMITEGSFANASGVPMVVQNTGANVLIQNATVINLQLR